MYSAQNMSRDGRNANCVHSMSVSSIMLSVFCQEITIGCTMIHGNLHWPQQVHGVDDKTRDSHSYGRAGRREGGEE